MLIEVKSKTNKPDGVPKKNEEWRGKCVGGKGEEGRLATGRQNALINFPLGPKSQAERGRGASVLWAGQVLRGGTKFMWAARRRSRRRQNFCIEFERAKQFRFFCFYFFR